MKRLSLVIAFALFVRVYGFNSFAEDTSDKLTFSAVGVSFEMVKVDGGSYQMGSYGGFEDESPVHSETVETFYICTTEVTQHLWTNIMGENPAHFKGRNNPVENISWNDCQKFLKRLNEITGKTFRLPTEAEWEFAARGGNRSEGFAYSGSDDLDKVAWYKENSGGISHPVAQKKPNELGVYDMSGNVWEWCADEYGRDYASPRNSSRFVHRGGAWNSSAANCRVSNRLSHSRTNRFNNVGLRLAL